MDSTSVWAMKSTNAGTTWSTVRTVTYAVETSASYQGIATSSNGLEVYLVDSILERLYYSSNGGLSWTTAFSNPNHINSASFSPIIYGGAKIAVSWSANKIALASFGTGGGNAATFKIMVSSNGGTSFSSTTGIAARWMGIAMSADGQTILSAPSFDVSYGGSFNLQLSSDGGTSWTSVAGPGAGKWNGIACDSICSKIVAVEHTTSGGRVWMYS
jgi:hypothetical protein